MKQAKNASTHYKVSYAPKRYRLVAMPEMPGVAVGIDLALRTVAGVIIKFKFYGAVGYAVRGQLLFYVALDDGKLSCKCRLMAFSFRLRPFAVL
jgi:hypothetical protein